MSYRIGLMASAVIPALVFLAAPALAQDTAQGADESGIGDIIVTAQKREERLQDVAHRHHRDRL